MKKKKLAIVAGLKSARESNKGERNFFSVRWRKLDILKKFHASKKKFANWNATNQFNKFYFTLKKSARGNFKFR